MFDELVQQFVPMERCPSCGNYVIMVTSSFDDGEKIAFDPLIAPMRVKLWRGGARLDPEETKEETKESYRTRSKSDLYRWLYLTPHVNFCLTQTKAYDLLIGWSMISEFLGYELNEHFSSASVDEVQKFSMQLLSRLISDTFDYMKSGKPLS